MWSLTDCRQVFFAVGLLGVIVCYVPAALFYNRLPAGEQFSELYFLGPERSASNYPSKVRVNEYYLVYLGVTNHLGQSTYYQVNIKFANQSDPSPNSTAGTPSSLPTLYSYRVLLADEETWEAPLNFFFMNATFDGNVSLVRGIKINDAVLDVEKMTTQDANSTSFYYRILAELWMYNTTSGMFAFHNRYVHLWLNMTKTF